MDPSDAKALDQLKQAVSATHIDFTNVANHALYTGVVFWLVIGAIVIAAIYFSHKTRTDRIRLLQTLAEKGQPIPPELLSGVDWGGSKGGVNYVARGIILISIGLAMVAFFLAARFSGGGGHSSLVAPFLGAFPLFLGLAYLGIGLYQRRHG